MTAPRWWIYQGTSTPHDGVDRLPPAPPWRAFVPDPSAPRPSPVPVQMTEEAASRRLGRWRRAAAYQADEKEIHLVNMALHLRRPLLVTGRPGVGKSTLAYSVAHELGLGPVLRWPISSKSVLQEGQYHYDAISRLQDIGLRPGHLRDTADPRFEPPDIGHYLRLGALGTALLPWQRPRVLLIDEIDKSDLDLPNDLLNVFEEGEFTVPELARLENESVQVMTADDGHRAVLRHGRVRCTQFPLVILTSNDEREFPPAFLRRCLRLEIPRADQDRLARMVAAHLSGPDAVDTGPRQELITRFLRKQREEGADLANDQLLNALLMAARGLWDDDTGRQLLDQHVLRSLGEG